MAGIENLYNNIETIGPTVLRKAGYYEPLTTPFTFASPCTDNWRVFDSDTTDPHSLTLFIPSSCSLSGGQAVHSPGTCLEGYTMVDLDEYRMGPDWTSGDSRVWAAACCSSGFTRLDKGCVSNFRTPVTGFYPKQDLTTSADIDGVYTYTSNDLEYRDNHTLVSSGTMMMDKMHVYWEESDLSKFDRDYASSLADVLLESNTFTPTVTTAAADISTTAADITSKTASPPNRSLPLTPATSSAVLDPTTEPDPASSSSGLSTGVKAGISAGAAVGAILFFFAGVLLYKKRLTRKARLDREMAKQNDQPEFVPVKEGQETFTLPNSEARWSRFLAGQ